LSLLIYAYLAASVISLVDVTPDFERIETAVSFQRLERPAISRSRHTCWIGLNEFAPIGLHAALPLSPSFFRFLLAAQLALFHANIARNNAFLVADRIGVR